MKNKKINFTINSSLMMFFLLFHYNYSNATESGFDVFNQMKQAYEKVESYNDTGIVENKYVRNGSAGDFMKALEFKTSYASHGDFLFEWSIDSKKFHLRENFVAEKDGVTIKVRNNNKSKQKSINDALSAVAGITDGASYLVTPYLFKEMHGLNISKVKSINVVEDGGSKRYKYELEVIFKHGGVYRYWLNDKYFITKHSSTLKLKNDVKLITEVTVFPKFD